MFTNFYDWYYPKLASKEAKAQKIQVIYLRFEALFGWLHYITFHVTTMSLLQLQCPKCSITFNIPPIVNNLSNVD